MTPREPDRYDKIARDIFAQWERTRNAYPRDIAAALRDAESSALERAAQAFAESPATQHSGAAVASILRYLKKSPAAVPAAEPCAVKHCPWPAGHGAIHGYAPPSEPVAPSLLPRVLAVLDAEYRRRGGDDGGGYVGALAAELRRYIAEMEGNDTNVPDDIDPRNLEKYDAEAQKRIAELEAAITAAHDYCLYMFKREWLTDPRNRAIFAARIFAILDAALADGGEGKT